MFKKIILFCYKVKQLSRYRSAGEGGQRGSSPGLYIFRGGKFSKAKTF